MNRFFFLPSLLWLAAALPLSADTAPARPRPNILWITAENMAPDLGCYPDSPWSTQVRTPNLDRLAREGLRYRLAFDTSPVCSSSRSAVMTGLYQTAIGAHHHRSHRDDHFALPAGVRPFPQRLAEAGYFSANVITADSVRIGTGKTDLNFEVSGPVLNPALAATLKPTGGAAIEGPSQNNHNLVRLYHTTEWTSLPSHQPFFAQINLPSADSDPKGWAGSAQKPWHGQTHPAITDPAKVTVPPYYPDHPLTRQDWAYYLDSVGGVDARVGQILARLEADGLADDTIVIFYADNGRQELRGLDWCYDSGDRVPLIIRWPKNFPAPPQYAPGKVSEQLISLPDLTATTLALAGVAKPAGMHGRVFLGQATDPERNVVFSARDRTDEAVNRIRSARNTRYRYIRNFMPERAFMAPHRFKEAAFPAAPLLRQLHAEGKLTPAQAALMAPRLPDEELYDLETDPFEIHNLAASPRPEHVRVKQELSAALAQWIEETNDQGRIPESAAIVQAWDRVEANLAANRVATAGFTAVAVLHDEAAFAGAHDVQVRDGLAFVAGKGFTSRAQPRDGVYPYPKGKGGSLAIVDVRQPAAPKILWKSDAPLSHEDAQTVLPLGGNRLLVGARDVFVLDVQDPAHPRRVATLSERASVDFINGVARRGDVVFGTNKAGAFYAIDVSSPDRLTLLGARQTKGADGFEGPHDGDLMGDFFVLVSPEGFGSKGAPGRLGVYRVFDAQTHRLLPADQWTLVGRLEHPNLAGANRVRTGGNFAYAASSIGIDPRPKDGLHQNVSVIDLSDPANPRMRGRVIFPDIEGPNGFEASGPVVFAAGGCTVQAIDVTQPDAPFELARFSSKTAFPAGRDDAHDLVYQNGHLFVTAQNSHSLVILKVSDAIARKIP